MKEKPGIPLRYWALWLAILVVADIVFYVLLTPLFAVVVRTRAPGKQTQPVGHALELRPERVRDAGFEPADQPGAPAGEQDARLPGFAEDLVEDVHAPDRE